MGSLYPGPRDRATRAAGTPDERRRRSADRRPGSGVARARGRDGLPGRRVRGPGRGRRRPRRQHQPDRLPGGLHRPLVRGPGRGHDLSADRQLRPARRRRPVDPARGSGRSSSPMPRPPCSTTRASWRRCCATTRSRPSPASTRGRSPATCARTAACAAIVTAPGRDRSRRGRRRGAGRHALGGPGLRRPGLAVGDHRHRARRGRRPAHRDRRLRAEVEHRPRDAPSRRPRPRLPAHGLVRPSLSRRTSTASILSPGPGDPARLDGPGRAGPGDHRRRPAAARHLPRPPDRRRGRPAPTRPGCGSATTARTTRSTTSSSGSSR